MTTTSLTPAQYAILAKVINISSGKIDWFPDNIKDDVCKKVLDGVFNCALITNDGTDWSVAAEGYGALGMKRPDVTLPIPEVDAELEHAMAIVEATWTPASAQVKPRTHGNNKQVEVVWMLQRPEGATIGQIHTTIGWQTYAAHGILAGTFKGKLGLTIVPDKPQDGEQVYHIA